MATTLINIQLQTSQLAATVAHKVAKASSLRHSGAQAVINEIRRAMGGTRDGSMTVSVESTTNTTKASMTITISHADVGTDGVTIGGVSFTEGTDWDAGADAAADATALAAAINASSDLEGIVDASAASGVVTLTATTPGRWGNLITVTTDDATAYTLSSATLTGATTAEQSAPRTWSFGL